MRPLLPAPLAVLLVVASACGGPSPDRAPAPGSLDPASAEHVLDLGSATLELPETWRPEIPSSSMRMAQASIPGTGGDATVAVFFFGEGGGGGTEANLQRWLGQIEAPAEPERGRFETDGFTVTWVDASGTLLPSGMGTGPSEPQPGSRLLAAVIEGPGGPWFVKATGPEATLADQRGAFLEMLQGVRPK